MCGFPIRRAKNCASLSIKPNRTIQRPNLSKCVDSATLFLLSRILPYDYGNCRLFNYPNEMITPSWMRACYLICWGTNGWQVRKTLLIFFYTYINMAGYQSARVSGEIRVCDCENVIRHSYEPGKFYAKGKITN